MPEAPTCPETATPDRLQKQAPTRLEVYVSSQCLNCDEAVQLAEEAAARYPNVVVRVVDLDLDGSPPPEPVVAVPTYVLNGRVVSLGNPYPEELFARLHEAVE
jgi:alkyl hydroperoxide reductase subunit AhpF